MIKWTLGFLFLCDDLLTIVLCFTLEIMLMITKLQETLKESVETISNKCPVYVRRNLQTQSMIKVKKCSLLCHGFDR